MSIRVTCPHCKGVMDAGDELRGRQARCPFCHKIVTVEPAAAPVPSPAAPQRPAPPERPAPREKPERKQAPPPPAPPVMPSVGNGTAEAAGAERGAVSVPASHVIRLAGDPPAPPRTERDNAQPRPPAKPTEATAPVGLVLGTQGHRKKRNRLVAMFKSLLQRGNPTDASVLLTAGIAVLLTVALYLIVEGVRPLRQSYIGVLLTERTWVVHCTVFFTLWAGTIMAVKWWKLASQQTALTYDLLPADPSVRITSKNIDLVQAHIEQLPVNPRRSFLVKRVLLALQHFKARKNVGEVGDVLTSQADTDGAMVESSFTMLKVLIWGIPILGFIGTVVGISEAVSGFTQSVQAAENLDVVKAALGNVTKGLAVAFDTTLIGLVLSLVVMFPTNSLQKAEDNLLSSVDQYCNEKLLSRLATDAETKTEEPTQDANAVRILVEAQKDWQQRLENLETALFEKVVDTLGEIRKEIAAKEPSRNDVPVYSAGKEGGQTH